MGLSLVAWMVIFTYVVWLAALHAMGCGPDGDEMHKLLLGLAPVATAFAFALRVTRVFPDIHRILSWLGAPVVLLLPFCVRNTWRVAAAANVEGAAICGGASAAAWEQVWAPAQILAMLLIATQLVAAWRSSRTAGAAPG